MTKKVSLKEYERRREVWLSALESGKFKQARHMLEMLVNTKTKTGKTRKVSSFCCLGVACKLFKEEAGLARKVDKENEMVEYAGQNGDAPYELAKYLGFRGALSKKAEKARPTFSGMLRKPVNETVNNSSDVQSANSLVMLNDGFYWDFKRIAKFIRENPSQVWEKGTYKSKRA